jgi:hypothetical protein
MVSQMAENVGEKNVSPNKLGTHNTQEILLANLLKAKMACEHLMKYLQISDVFPLISQIR